MVTFRSAAASGAALALGFTLLAGPGAGADTHLESSGSESSTALHTGITADSQAGPEIVDHGVALESVNFTGTDLIETRADGREVAYIFNSGQPISLNVLDMETLEVIDRQELPNHSTFASRVVDEDDTLYFSVRSPNDGTLFKYDPYEQEITELATDVVGEGMLRSMIIMDGVIYGSTYPNAKVFSYDLETGEIHDYGTVEEDSAYAWGFEEVDGKLWVGTGTTPRLREVDPETGDITDIELPEHMTADGKDFIHDIIRRDNLVFLRASPAGTENLAIYDLEADEWCCQSTELMGTWSLNSYDDKFYYIVGTEVRGYDMQSREDFSVGWNESNMAGEQSGSSAMQIVELDDEDYPGPTLMGFRDGVMWYYSLENESGEIIELPIEGAPATIQSAGMGPDGNPYVGAYLSSGIMSRVDHETGEVESLEGPEQGDAVRAVGDHLVIGTYSGAGFYAGDMDQDWDWGANPEHLFSIGREAGQDRVSDIIDTDGLAAAATIPNYGELGGALVLFDPAADDEPQVHRHIVEDHSVVSLAYQDGFIYGGTSIHGGIDSSPAQGPAELFVWDVEAQERVDSIVPDEDADIIHTLTFDDEGRLWGMTDNGTMFEFDTDTREVGATVTTGLGNSNIWGRTSEMAPNPVDGLIYGNASSRIFTFNPETLDFTILESESIRYSTVHEDGTFYFTDRTNIYSLTPEGGEEVCDETISGTYNGPVTVNEGTTCFTDASVRGPVNVSAGASLHITDSKLTGALHASGAESIVLENSNVTGPLHISDSRSVVLRDNEITGSLHCTGNDEPLDVGGNTIRGANSGQCQEPVVEELEVDNSGFEEPVVDGEIPGWEIIFGLNGAGGGEIVDDVSHSGEYSYRLEDPEDDIAYGLLSDPIEVTGGQQYEASYYAWVEEGTPSLYVYFYDEHGEQIGVGSEHFRDLPSEQWLQVSLQEQIPKDAVTMTICIYSMQSSISTFYADDVALTVSE